MLSDRSYMREAPSRSSASVLTWLICALIAGFFVQNIFGIYLHQPIFYTAVALSSYHLAHGWIWTLFTYPLLHESVWHLLGSLLFIFFFGRELQPVLGEKRLGWLAVTAGAVGGLFWFATNFVHGGEVIGASGIAMAFLTVFACLWPNRPITFLLFFVLPVTIRPKWLVWVLGGIDVIGFLFNEIPGQLHSDGIAHSVHLGGLLTGWLYFRYVHDRGWGGSRVAIELPKWMRKSRSSAVVQPAFQVNVNSPTDMRAEVDRILDKINSHGFGALSTEEKRVLDNARDLLTRR